MELPSVELPPVEPTELVVVVRLLVRCCIAHALACPGVRLLRSIAYTNAGTAPPHQHALHVPDVESEVSASDFAGAEP
eukprot:12721700-Alexandrium_andersonii.AAC.1